MKILGHRGITNGEDTLFENSLPAFAYALRHADGIETDACLSADGEIFLLHEMAKDGQYCVEDYLSKESNAQLAGSRLDMLTASDIKKLTLKNGAPIPTLSETINLFTAKTDKILNIELKSQGVEKALIPLLKKAFDLEKISPKQVILSSFNHEQLAIVKAQLPNVKTGALFVTNEDDGTAIYPWLKDGVRYKSASTENLKAVAKQFDCFVLPYTDNLKEVLTDVHQQFPKIHIIIWVSSKVTNFNLQHFKRYADGLVEAVIVNDPNQTYDIAIIGGGINGCGIARDASLRGLKVYLCDKSGIGNETSSYSTKLIHGGLRYLETGDFLMVWKALRERESLYRIAPHIVRPATFILPYQPHLRPKFLIQLGLWIYDALAFPNKFKKSGLFEIAQTPFAQDLEKHITHAFRYTDCRTDDHRLVILNALDAQKHGATVEPYTACTEIKPVDGIWHITAGSNNIKAKTVINATGPWAQNFADMQKINIGHKTLKLIKGSHIVVPKLFEHEHCYIFQHKDNRVIFALPYENDFTLIGTTEETVKNAENPTCSEGERQYLCDVVNQYFKKQITPEEIVWDYAGIRPIIDEKSKNNRTASRDYTLDLAERDGAALLNIWGGKLTTYRTLAQKALAKLAPYHPLLTQHTCITDKALLPGGEKSPREIRKVLEKTHPFIPQDTLKRYSRSYGTLCHQFLTSVSELKGMGQDFGFGLYQVEVDYLLRHEWCQTAEDILWKKTKLGLHFSNAEKNALTTYIQKKKPHG
jgi:glycerol-3-phosphate dehydrogenase